MGMDTTTRNLLILIAVLVAFPGITKNFGGLFGAQTADGIGTRDGILIDHITEDTTITFRAVNKYQTPTAITNEFVLLFKDGFDAGLISVEGGTVTATPNDVLTLYWFENSSTYYTDKEIITVPDRGTFDLQGQAKQFDTSMTLTFFDEDDTSNTAQVLGADDEAIMAIKYKASSKRAFGNPGCPGAKVAICFEYNTSVYDAVEIMVGGVPQPTIATPTTLSNFGNASFAFSCYAGDGVENTQSKKYTVRVDTGNRDPGTTDDIAVYYEDCDFDRNANTGAEIYGFVDESNNDLGTKFQRDIIEMS